MLSHKFAGELRFIIRIGHCWVQGTQWVQVSSGCLPSLQGPAASQALPRSQRITGAEMDKQTHEAQENRRRSQSKHVIGRVESRGQAQCQQGGVSVCSGCHNRRPSATRLQQQKCLLSQAQRLEIPDQGISRDGVWLACRQMRSRYVLTCPFLCAHEPLVSLPHLTLMTALKSLSLNTVPLGLGPQHTDLVGQGTHFSPQQMGK